jgi:hypothetical protein
MRLCRTVLLLAFFTYAALSPQPVLAVGESSPFDKLTGRWVGEGRLGARDGKTEAVKCRVTYIRPADGDEVRQTIRCASQSGSVEVQSVVAHAAGKLTGTWKELTREWSGDLSGNITPRGFKVAIKGSDLTANMDIVINDNRQIIEIQFIGSSLIGLTLVLTKG